MAQVLNTVDRLEGTARISFATVHSSIRVSLMRVLRYLQIGYLLHLMGLFSILCVILLTREFIYLWHKEGSIAWKVLCGYGSLYFFTLVFFSQFDARSRYQNYKMIKDRFHQYGFDKRILKPFVYSRCQRDAIGVAARDLNFSRQWKQLKQEYAFRWYHILPTLVLRSPRLLFTREYWEKTLFVKRYRLKYFLW